MKEQNHAARTVVDRDPLACRVRWHDHCIVVRYADGSVEHGPYEGPEHYEPPFSTGDISPMADPWDVPGGDADLNRRDAR